LSRFRFKFTFPQKRLGKALNNPAYTDIGVEQAIAYIDALQLESGIFDHFFLNGVPGTWGQGWGRGQGWALLGMLDVLHQIPKTHSGYNKIKAAAEAGDVNAAQTVMAEAILDSMVGRFLDPEAAEF
jgi:unsaturated rhamnogalacturonyl hydrolase